MPPFVFYSFQFYPEMLGALVMTAALRALLFGRPATARSALALGLALASLPWLHQKFLPVWLALARVGRSSAPSRTWCRSARSSRSCCRRRPRCT